MIQVSWIFVNSNVRHQNAPEKWVRRISDRYFDSRLQAPICRCLPPGGLSWRHSRISHGVGCPRCSMGTVPQCSPLFLCSAGEPWTEWSSWPCQLPSLDAYLCWAAASARLCGTTGKDTRRSEPYPVWRESGALGWSSLGTGPARSFRDSHCCFTWQRWMLLIRSLRHRHHLWMPSLDMSKTNSIKVFKRLSVSCCQSFQGRRTWRKQRQTLWIVSLLDQCSDWLKQKLCVSFVGCTGRTSLWVKKHFIFASFELATSGVKKNNWCTCTWSALAYTIEQLISCACHEAQNPPGNDSHSQAHIHYTLYIIHSWCALKKFRLRGSISLSFVICYHYASSLRAVLPFVSTCSSLSFSFVLQVPGVQSPPCHVATTFCCHKSWLSSGLSHEVTAGSRRQGVSWNIASFWNFVLWL